MHGGDCAQKHNLCPKALRPGLQGQGSRVQSPPKLTLQERQYAQAPSSPQRIAQGFQPLGAAIAMAYGPCSQAADPLDWVPKERLTPEQQKRQAFLRRPLPGPTGKGTGASGSG